MERNRLSTRIQETQVTKEQETTKALEEHRLNATLRVKLDRVINKLRRVKSEHKRQNDELNRQKELTRHVSKLERNIASLKAAKVSLMKRRRQEEKQYKVWRKESNRKIVTLRNNIVRSFFSNSFRLYWNEIDLGTHSSVFNNSTPPLVYRYRTASCCETLKRVKTRSNRDRSSTG